MNTVPLTDNPYLIELLTPSQASSDLDRALARFRERYLKILASGGVISIPDNPMGTLRFTALEILSHLELPVEPEQLLVHMNSFHRRSDLDESLAGYHSLGVKYLLCVSGDGGSHLPRLEPADLGSEAKTVTAVELLEYISSRQPAFRLGVAYNHYEPLEHEQKKLKQKIAAGGEFVITQPVTSGTGNLAPLFSTGLPVILGAWMSDNIELLYQCLGTQAAAPPSAYAGDENLKLLHAQYPHRGFYLSLLSFARDWNEILPGLKRALAPRS
jgi:methylenetetrahydrofolate reductase (NADPH)